MNSSDSPSFIFCDLPVSLDAPGGKIASSRPSGTPSERYFDGCGRDRLHMLAFKPDHVIDVLCSSPKNPHSITDSHFTNV